MMADARPDALDDTRGGDGDAPRRQNLLLRQVGDNRLRELFPRAERVHLAAHRVLHEGGGEVDAFYFPVDCLLSGTMVLSDGGAVEVSTIGYEGMSGLAELLTGTPSGWTVAVLVPGAAVRIGARALREAMAAEPRLGDALRRYAGAALREMARTIACNSLHTTEQRCARWLLESSDRVRADRLPVTHEQLAQVLGVRRPGLSTCLGRLQLLGLVRQHRGGIAIADRRALAALACECHGAGAEDRRTDPR